jgi:hypothetical protein
MTVKCRKPLDFSASPSLDGSFPQFFGLPGARVIAIVMFVPDILIALKSIDIRKFNFLCPPL